MGDLLQVRDLTIEYGSGKRNEPALDRITFDVRQGEVVGILGESGSGKTTIGLAMLRLLASNARTIRGSIRLRERELLELSERQYETLRGSEISMIFQEPAAALNPFIRAVDQVSEVIAAHRRWPRRRCHEEARKVLATVRLDEDPRILSAYPHQLSGGEQQRLVIAQALACRPTLLIADEPSTALDSILQSELLTILKGLRDQLGLTLLLITHDPSVLAGIADRVIILYAGRIVEEARLQQLVDRPLHPYTQALLRAVSPRPGAVRHQKRFPVVNSINSMRSPAGCPFEPRCQDRLPVCSREDPPEVVTDELRRVRCFQYVE
jgi:oligopeptide/dipeptide ABC transporter ATP-binding protein